MKKLQFSFNLLDENKLDLMYDGRLVGEIVRDDKRHVYWMELFGLTNRSAQSSEENAMEAARAIWE